MDTFHQAAAHTTRRPRTAILQALTPEEKATYRRWARIVLACYCLVLIWGCITVLGNYSTANSGDQLAQATTQRNSTTRAGR
jgi:cytochrome c-type biogenesis protein CcmH/NrfG